jgi:hypothetical protein
MEIKQAIYRRVMAVNPHTTTHIDQINETDSGGIHLVMAICNKRMAVTGNFYIPHTMRPDLEQGRRNRALDDRLRL